MAICPFLMLSGCLREDGRPSDTQMRSWELDYLLLPFSLLRRKFLGESRTNSNDEFLLVGFQALL